MSSYQYRISHCGDKTILRPSYLHNGISYAGKVTSLYWISPLYPPPWGHIMVVFYIRASYRLLSLSFHDNQASHSRDTIWPWKFKVKGQGQRYPSQHSVQLTLLLSVSYQGILSTPIPFAPWQSPPPPIPKIQLDLENSRSKVKVKGTLVSVASSWPISFLFHINWTIGQPCVVWRNYSFRGFPRKLLAERRRRRWRRRRKRTKNNMSSGYPGWLNEDIVIRHTNVCVTRRKCLKHIETETKLPRFRKRYFQDFTEVCS